MSHAVEAAIREARDSPPDHRWEGYCNCEYCRRNRADAAKLYIQQKGKAMSIDLDKMQGDLHAIRNAAKCRVALDPSDRGSASIRDLAASLVEDVDGLKKERKLTEMRLRKIGETVVKKPRVDAEAYAEGLKKVLRSL